MQTPINCNFDCTKRENSTDNGEVLICSLGLTEKTSSTNTEILSSGQLLQSGYHRMSPLVLSPSAERSGKRRHLLQDEDRSRNDPRLVPGFLHSCPGCSRNSSGLYPDMRIQKNIVQFRQSTQNSAPCPTELLR